MEVNIADNKWGYSIWSEHTKTDKDILVECCRCKNRHLLGLRLAKPNTEILKGFTCVCPRCLAKSYLKINTVIE